MKIRTGHITSIKFPIKVNVRFICSKCGKNNGISYTFYLEKEIFTSLGTPDSVRKVLLIGELQKKLKKIISELKKNNYRNFDLKCSCAYCRNKEVWTKYVYMNRLTHRFMRFLEIGDGLLVIALALAFVSVITSIFKPPISVILIALAFLTPLLVIGIAKIINIFVQRRVNSMEYEFHPKITIVQGNNKEKTL